MDNKTVIITGANSGIGKAASLLFARHNCTVIMACRNIERSKQVQEEIISESGNQDVILMRVDMSSFDSIHAFCEDYKRKFQKLDILIHNAAYFNHGEKYRLSSDHIELTFATNTVGPFLMTHLLLEPLKKSSEPKVLNASSNIIKHFFSPKKVIAFDNLKGMVNKKLKHSVYNSYRDSKMALVMLTFKMAENFKEHGIRVNALQINGARMSSATLKKFKPIWRVPALVQNLFFPPAEFMANNYFQICTSGQFSNTSGKLINHKLEIMEAGPENPGFKDIWGASVY
ncbi:MAG TPA: SDR family NAD(P)-dependent oxidoreductase, partial [Bacteroidales bacterium]|nr:SDR family NAD(P)-dependent oxidoreductase [Bacteroidales bacterium]